MKHYTVIIKDRKVAAGTIAQIIQTGQMVTLDMNDKFYAEGVEVSRS